MRLIDANLLVYAANRDAPQHEAAAAWLQDQLNGDAPVGLPWESLTAFLRIATNARIFGRPLSLASAWSLVEEWLGASPAWIPQATERHAQVLGVLTQRHGLTGNLIPDGHLVALAIEHGLELCSADADFSRFHEIRWVNPLS